MATLQISGNTATFTGFTPDLINAASATQVALIQQTIDTQSPQVANMQAQIDDLLARIATLEAESIGDKTYTLQFLSGT